MENLVLASKVLYERDYIRMKNRIQFLENELRKHAPPKKKYPNKHSQQDQIDITYLHLINTFMPVFNKMCLNQLEHPPIDRLRKSLKEILFKFSEEEMWSQQESDNTVGIISDYMEYVVSLSTFGTNSDPTIYSFMFQHFLKAYADNIGSRISEVVEECCTNCSVKSTYLSYDKLCVNCENSVIFSRIDNLRLD